MFGRRKMPEAAPVTIKTYDYEEEARLIEAGETNALRVHLDGHPAFPFWRGVIHVADAISRSNINAANLRSVVGLGA